jgi:hypothetical protein
MLFGKIRELTSSKIVNLPKHLAKKAALSSLSGLRVHQPTPTVQIFSLAKDKQQENLFSSIFVIYA